MKKEETEKKIRAMMNVKQVADYEMRATEASRVERVGNMREALRYILNGDAEDEEMREKGLSVYDEIAVGMVAGIKKRGCRPEEVKDMLKITGELEEGQQINISLVDADLASKAIENDE